MLVTGGTAMPALSFTALTTDTDRNIHRGLTLMIRGLFSAFRNPTAMKPRSLGP